MVDTNERTEISYNYSEEITDYPIRLNVYSESDLSVTVFGEDGMEALLPASAYTISGDPPAMLILDDEYVMPFEVIYLTIERSMDFLQPQNFPANEDVSKAILERVLDRLVMMIGQVYRYFTAGISAPVSETTDMILPTAALRRGSYLAYSGEGKASVLPPYFHDDQIPGFHRPKLLATNSDEYKTNYNVSAYAIKKRWLDAAFKIGDYEVNAHKNASFVYAFQRVLLSPEFTYGEPPHSQVELSISNSGSFGILKGVNKDTGESEEIEIGSVSTMRHPVLAFFPDRYQYVVFTYSTIYLIDADLSSWRTSAVTPDRRTFGFAPIFANGAFSIFVHAYNGDSAIRRLLLWGPNDQLFDTLTASDISIFVVDPRVEKLVVATFNADGNMKAELISYLGYPAGNTVDIPYTAIFPNIPTRVAFAKFSYFYDGFIIGSYQTASSGVDVFLIRSFDGNDLPIFMYHVDVANITSTSTLLVDIDDATGLIVSLIREMDGDYGYKMTYFPGGLVETVHVTATPPAGSSANNTYHYLQAVNGMVRTGYMYETATPGVYSLCQRVAADEDNDILLHSFETSEDNDTPYN